MADLRSGADPIDSLLGWSQSVAALAQAQAQAAQALAASQPSSSGAGSTGSGGRFQIVDPPFHIDLNNPPTVVLDGNFVGSSCPYGWSDNWVSESLDNGGFYYFSDPDPYEARLLTSDWSWMIVINGCS